MTQNNPLLKEAKAIAKRLKVDILGWGPESLITLEPEDKSVTDSLVQQLSGIGFNITPSEEDKKDAILTFTTINFKSLQKGPPKILKIIFFILNSAFFYLFAVNLYNAYTKSQNDWLIISTFFLFLSAFAFYKLFKPSPQNTKK